MRILVTGATGFIGRALVRSLANVHQVRATVRRMTLLNSFPPNVDIVAQPDLVEPVDWNPLVADIDAVIHLAGIAHAGPKMAEASYDRVNRTATGELALAAVRAGVGRFVFISSIAAQTGPSADHILMETDEPRPSNAYGRSKLGAEAAVRSSGVPFTILRPVLVYGPGVKGNMLQLMQLADLPIPLPFSGFINRRSLVALDNLIGAIRFVLDNPVTLNEIYIVSDPEPVPLRDIIISLRARNGRKPWLFNVKPAVIERLMRLVGRKDLWDRIGGSLIANPGKLVDAGWLPLGSTRTLLYL